MATYENHRQGPIPTMPLAHGTVSTTRRRAALGSPGHAASGGLSGHDGEVCVRFEAIYHRADPACGERRLLLAVLEDGIRAYLKHARATHGRPFNLRREALLWLTNDEQSDVFAYESICEALGIDADRLRRRVFSEAARPIALH